MSEPVEPCPTCPEGWRPLDKAHCASCYEGQIERLQEQLAIAMTAQRRINSLAEKNVPKYAQQIARDGTPAPVGSQSKP
jgi:DNA repair exonuclease SbcCD ATPase subunit